MKLNEQLNREVNKLFVENLLTWAIQRGVTVPASLLWRMSGSKGLYERLRRKVLQHDNPEEFNFVNGGFFTRDKNLRSLNKRIAQTALGDYLMKDGSGNIVFDYEKLEQLKKENPDLYKKIMTLQNAIASGNNRSNVFMTRKAKDNIRNALNDLEMDVNAKKHNKVISQDTIRILSNNPTTKKLLDRYRYSAPGSELHEKLYKQLMDAERKIVNSRKNIKRTDRQVKDVEDFISKKTFYK